MSTFRRASAGRPGFIRSAKVNRKKSTLSEDARNNAYLDLTPEVKAKFDELVAMLAIILSTICFSVFLIYRDELPQLQWARG
jgi:hypothetical protein